MTVSKDNRTPPSPSIMDKFAFLIDEVKCTIFAMLTFCYGFVPLWSYLETLEWGQMYLFGPQHMNLATLVTFALWYFLVCYFYLPVDSTPPMYYQQLMRAGLNLFLLICVAILIRMWKQSLDPTCTRFMCAYFGPRNPWLTLVSNLGLGTLSRGTINLALASSSQISECLGKYTKSKRSICIIKEDPCIPISLAKFKNSLFVPAIIVPMSIIL